MAATPLQTFSELVAMDVDGPPIDPGVIEWIALIEMIMTMISEIMANCNASDAGVREAVKSPSLWQRVQVRRVVRRVVREDCNGFGLRWRNKVNVLASSMMDLGAQQPDEVIDAVVDQVRNSSF